MEHTDTCATRSGGWIAGECNCQPQPEPKLHKRWTWLWESRAKLPRPFFFRFTENDPTGDETFRLYAGAGPLMLRYARPAAEPKHWKWMWRRIMRPFFFSAIARDPANDQNFFICLGAGPLLLRYCNPPVVSDDRAY